MPKSDAFTAIDKVHAAWLGGEVTADEIQSEGWTVHEWRYFLNNLPRKLIVPMYKALLETPKGRAMAMSIFAKASPGYHVVARNTIRKLLAQ